MKPYFQLDDITWNDLDLEEVLKLIDTSKSSVGSEKLRSILKTPLFDKNEFDFRNERINVAYSDSSGCDVLSDIFNRLGKLKKTSFYEYIFKIKDLGYRSSLLNYMLALLLICAVILIFIMPVAGVIAFVVMVAINISVYFKEKSKVEGYFNSLKYLVSMVICAKRIIKSNSKVLDLSCFSQQVSVLKDCVNRFSGMTWMSWLITNSISGSVIDVIMDYIRMLFHIDLIKFNSMLKIAVSNENEIDNLFNALGEIESDICIARYRKVLKFYCVPEFCAEKKLSAVKICHPLIANPVPNSIDIVNSVLLTGSNASGKSTFLKAIAVNQIFAQTICTCFAESFKTSFCKIYSSMALNDNILNNESYFVVEIKSLKRIFDDIGENRIICFIDEILRGTNTVERIASSSQLMKALAKYNVFVFAATHDIELTELLSDCYSNYHFSETIEGDGATFDYKLKDGAAVSGNAVELLKAYNFPPEIIGKASESVTEYLKTGRWNRNI